MTRLSFLTASSCPYMDSMHPPSLLSTSSPPPNPPPPPPPHPKPPPPPPPPPPCFSTLRYPPPREAVPPPRQPCFFLEEPAEKGPSFSRVLVSVYSRPVFSLIPRGHRRSSLSFQSTLVIANRFYVAWWYVDFTPPHSFPARFP